MPDVAQRGFAPQVADLRNFSNVPPDLSGRISLALAQFPCDIMFIHRDAERREGFQERLDEIRAAAKHIAAPPYVAIIPVRMTEAWLLLEGDAIRMAADNPNGAIELNCPPVTNLESLPDPKQVLEELLVLAAEKMGRRRDQFKRDLPLRRQRVAELIRDFSPLRRLPAFQAFERDLRLTLGNWNANNP